MRFIFIFGLALALAWRKVTGSLRSLLKV